MDILFAINEIGNLPPTHGLFEVKVFCENAAFVFLPQEMQDFRPCPTKIAHKSDLMWRLSREKSFSEDEIYEFTSSKLNVEIFAASEDVKDSSESNLLAQCSIDLITVLPDDLTNIAELKMCPPPPQVSPPHWTGEIFIKYQLASLAPLWDSMCKTYSFHLLSLRVNGIQNATATAFANCDAMDIGIPLWCDGKAKICFFHLTKEEFEVEYQSDAPSQNVTLAKVFECKLLDQSQDQMLSKEECENPNANQANITFSKDFNCKLLKRSLDTLIANGKTAVEVKIQTSESAASNGNHFYGIVDISQFSWVGVRKLNLEVLLKPFNPAEYRQEVPNLPQSFPSEAKRVSKAKPKPKKRNSKLTSKESSMNTSYEEIRTSIQIEILICPELIKPKEFVPCFEKMCPCPSEMIGKVDTKPGKNIQVFAKIYSNEHQTALSEYDRYKALRFPTALRQSGAIFVKNEQSLLQSLIYKSIAVDCKPYKSLEHVEELYVDGINFIEKYLNGTQVIGVEQLKLKRIEWANELLELNLLNEAQDMYIMNIADNVESAAPYVDYGIFNLRIRNMEKAFKCFCIARQKRDEPVKYLARFLIASILFHLDKHEECEKHLLQLTKECVQFVEAWLALILVYSQKGETKALECYTDGLKRAKIDPLRLRQHDHPPYFLQRTTNQNGDPQIEALVNMIRWGCLQFAEIGFTFLEHKHSFDCLFISSVIHYQRKDFPLVLKTLEIIFPKNTCQEEQKYHLALQCYLSMGSLEESRCILKSIKSNMSDCFLNIVYLKIAKLYMDMKKFRTARFYLKKSMKLRLSYAACRFLGYVALQCKNRETSDNCFKVAYGLNPKKCLSRVLT